MKSGVRKSGWPMPRLMMSRPCAIRALARASTAKAFSSPMRSKAAIVFSMALLPETNLILAAVHPIREEKSNRRQQVRLYVLQTRRTGKLHGAHQFDAQVV